MTGTFAGSLVHWKTIFMYIVATFDVWGPKDFDTQWLRIPISSDDFVSCKGFFSNIFYVYKWDRLICVL